MVFFSRCDDAPPQGSGGIAQGPPGPCVSPCGGRALSGELRQDLTQRASSWSPFAHSPRLRSARPDRNARRQSATCRAGSGCSCEILGCHSAQRSAQICSDLIGPVRQTPHSDLADIRRSGIIRGHCHCQRSSSGEGRGWATRRWVVGTGCGVVVARRRGEEQNDVAGEQCLREKRRRGSKVERERGTGPLPRLVVAPLHRLPAPWIHSSCGHYRAAPSVPSTPSALAGRTKFCLTHIASFRLPTSVNFLPWTRHNRLFRGRGMRSSSSSNSSSNSSSSSSSSSSQLHHQLNQELELHHITPTAAQPRLRHWQFQPLAGPLRSLAPARGSRWLRW